MKKIISLLTVLLIIFSLSSCSSKCEIPDLSSCDESSAKTLLLNLGLVPVFETEFSDEIEAGLVSRCEPAIGEKVESGSKVTVYISLGASSDTAENWQWNYGRPFEYESINNDYVLNINNLKFENNVISFDISAVFGRKIPDYGYDCLYEYSFKFQSQVTAYINNTPINSTISGEAVDKYHTNSYDDGTAYTHNLKVTIPLDEITEKRPLSITLDFPFSEMDYVTNYKYPEYSSEKEINYTTQIQIMNIVW